VDGIAFNVSSSSFSFNVTNYDINENWKVSHKKDLIKSNGSFVHLDYRMSGVGSHSCGGDDPQKECRINGGEKLDFTFVIKPQNA
jgi:beta-galactosidase